MTNEQKDKVCKVCHLRKIAEKISKDKAFDWRCCPYQCKKIEDKKNG